MTKFCLLPTRNLIFCPLIIAGKFSKVKAQLAAVRGKSLVLFVSVFVFLLSLIPVRSLANVTVTAPALTVYACGGSFPTASYTLGNISITEGAKGDISVFGSLILTAPVNFEFTSAGIGSFTGTNVSGVTAVLTNSTTITISITGSGTNSFDNITLSGIQVRGIGGISGPANITRTGGTSVIANDANGVIHGTLTSQVGTPPNSPTGTSGVRCGTGTVIISATAAAGETIDWYAASTGGVALSSGNISYTTVSISSTTNYFAQARNTTTGCVSATRTAVTATINILPAAPAGIGAARCGTGSVAISATASGGETIDWYAAASGGSALLSGNSSYTTPGISTTTPYYAQTRNLTSGCVSATRTAVTAIINTLPLAPAAGNAGTCGSGTVTITATPGSGQTIDWYDAASGGTLLLTGNSSFTTPAISITTVYYAQSRNTTTGCISATRTAVTATVNALPAAPTGTGAFTCGSGAVTISASPGSGETIDWYAVSSGGTALLSGNSSYTTPFISSTTTYYAQSRNLAKGCLSATRTAVMAIVNVAITNNIVTPTGHSGCGVAFMGNVPTGSCDSASFTYQWYWSASINGSYTLITDSSRKDLIPTDGGAKNNWYIRRAFCGSCYLDSKPDRAKAQLAFGTITASNVTCFSTNTGKIVANASGGTAPYYFTWSDSLLNSISTDKTYNTSDSILNLYAGTYNLQLTDTFNCKIYTAVTITQPQLPNAAISGTVTICAGSPDSVTFIGSAGTKPYRFTYNINGGATFMTNAGDVVKLPVPTGAAGTFIYNLLSVLDANGCSQLQSGTITVTVNPLPSASISGTTTVCLNSTSPGITFTGSNGTAPYTFTYTINAGANQSVITTSGSSVSVNAPTTTGGTFIYTLVSVQDASSTSCLQLLGGTATVTVNPVTVGGTLPSGTACSAGSATLILSGNVGNVTQWESSTDNGTNWTIIANSTTSLTYIVTSQTTLYRVLVQSGLCSSAYSTIATSGLHNVWTGVTSTDWFTTSNWSDGQLPSLAPCPTVTIPQVPAGKFYPIISSGTASVNDLVIDANASLTVIGGIMQVAGAITNNGTFDVTTGGIEFNGSSAQSISANVFYTNKIQDLIISNNVSLNGIDSLTGSLSFGNSNKTFTTNGNLILKSSAVNTAAVGQIINGNAIAGDVTVERYIGTGTTHAKSWQLLAVPTTGQTIKQSWQEGATVSDVGGSAAGNPNPGYGAMLTSNVAGAASQPNPGFDAFTAPGPSIKVYNSATGNYDGPTSTAIPIYNQKGYFILVRGDRSVYTSAAAANATVLRTKGTLFTPSNPPPATTVLPNRFESVGNPYASAIDVRNLSFPAGINSTIIVWDPTLGLGSANGLGAYQTLYLNSGNYVNLLPSVAYGTAGTVNNNIQSGQAFIIQALPTIGGTLSFTENVKAGGSKLLTRPQGANEEKPVELRTNLWGINAGGNAFITDGTLVQFNDAFSDLIDGMDVYKMTNTAENLAIKTGGKLLAIERRHTIESTDTIFFNLTGVKVQTYNFEFITNGLDNQIAGFLEDNYLHTRTPLNNNGTTVVSFSIVNIAGSFAPDRFRIVFSPAVMLPVTFTSLKASIQEKNIDVEWKVENEMNMKQYEVQKSTDGIIFTTFAIKAASANGGRSATYITTDGSPLEGYNYYRVKSMDISGKTAYTNVVKVLMGSIKQDIIIYPNPITDGMIHLKLINQPEGKYGMRLLNKTGQVILSENITHGDGSSTELVKWDYKLAHGLYHLEVTKPDHTIIDITVLY